MNGTLKLGLMVLSTLGVLAIVAYVISEIVFRLTKDE
jgi:hypothetical protein